MLAQLHGGDCSPLDWSPDDATLLALQEISITESYLWSIDVASRQQTLLTPKPAANTVAYTYGQYSKDGKSVYVITDFDSDFRRVARIDLETHRPTFLTSHIHWDISEAQLSPDGKTLAVVSNEDGKSTLHLLDAMSRREKPLRGFPPGYVIDLYWHRKDD